MNDDFKLVVLLFLIICLAIIALFVNNPNTNCGIIYIYPNTFVNCK